MSENNTMIFTLTFDLDGGEGEFETLSGEASSYHKLPSGTPFRAGYGFMGWENCAGEIFQPGSDYWFNYGNDTLVAVWKPITLTLTFETNGSMDEYPPITGLETESIFLGNVPIREGYYFSRWENSWGISFNAGDQYTFNYGNDTLTAIWGSTTTFDLAGGEGNFPDISGEIMINTLIPEETPTKAGYNFVKWISAKYGNMLPGDPYFFTGDDTLTAVWEIAWHTLTYDLNEADAPESISPQEGQATTNIILSDIVPEKEGYTFVRWENSEKEAFQPGDPYFFDYHDDTLKAVWGYTVTLDFGDGRTETVKGGVGETLDFVPTSEYGIFYSWINNDYMEFFPGEYTFTHGDDYLTAMWGYSVSYDTNGGIEEFPTQMTLLGGIVTIPATIPTRAGYEFKAWESPSGELFYPGDEYGNSETTVLKAKWICLITFDNNDGNVWSAIIDSDTFELHVPERDGFTFIKWVNSAGVEFYPGDVYEVIYGSDTLTAVWGYTIAFDTEGVGLIESVSGIYGEAITLPELEREGYNFICWRDGQGTDYIDTYHVYNGHDTLVAVWELKTYSVSYDVEGFAEQTKEYFTSIALHSNIPTKEGFTFFNWEGDNGVYYDAGEEYTVNANLSLTAVWVADGETVITYELDGGTGEFPRQTKGIGESITLHTEKPVAGSGIGFYRWIDQNGNMYQNGDTYSGSESLKLSVIWKPEYTITYLGKNNKVYKTQPKLEGETINLLYDVPTMVNYEFAFWVAINADGTYYPGDEFSLDCNVTLKPAWIPLYDIIYKNGSSFIHYDEARSGESYTVNDIMVEKEGYDFACWKIRGRDEYYYPGEEITVNEMVILEAVWIETEKAAVIFDVGDADGEFEMQVVDINTGITIPYEIPAKENCIFVAWEKVSSPDSAASTYNMMRTTEAQSQTVYNAGDEYVVSETTVFRALFEQGVKIISKPYNNTISLSEISYQLTFALDPTMYGADIQWTSSNFKVASVTGHGVVNLKTPGQTTITVTATVGNGAGALDVCKDSFVLTVFYGNANNVSFKITNKPEKDFAVLGQIVNLGIEADFSAENVIWRSQNPSVATISSDGVITAVSEGETLIIASIVVGSYENAVEYTDSFLLTVKDEVFVNKGGDFGDENIKDKAIGKMKEYYYSKPELKEWIGQNKTCIFAFEGLGSGKQGISATTNPNYHASDGYLNAMMVVTEGKNIVYVTRNASTLPDNRPDKLSPNQYKEIYGSGKKYTPSTTLEEGIYDYETGYHRDLYLGLLPSGSNGKPTEWKGWYLNGNENDFHSGDCSGINIHAAGINPKASKDEANSLGCQIVWAGEYIDFGKKVGFIKDTVENNWNDNQGVSSFMTSKLKSSEENGIPIYVKYILNRDYDSKNIAYENDTASNCNNGVFYPIVHNSCITGDEYKCTKC